MFKRLMSSSLVRNSSWLMAGQGMSVVVQATYFIFLARLLGAHQYGLLVGATALIALVSQHSSMGSGFIFLRYVSPDLSKFGTYWGYVLTSTVVGASIIVTVITVLSHWILPKMDPTAVICLAIGDCLFLQLTNGAGRVFQTFERMHFSAASSLIVNTLRLCTAGCMLKFWHHATATNWAVASMLVSAVGSTMAIILISVVFGRPRWFGPLLKKHTIEGLLFSSSTTTSSVFNDIDKVLLGHYGMTVANAIYAMAYKAIDTSFMVIRSIYNAAFPRFCREGASGVAATRVFAKSLLSKTFWISIAISVLLFFCAPLIPKFVGEAFAPSVLALRYLCIIPVLRSCHMSAGDAIAGAGFQRIRFSYELGAAVVNLGLNLWLIPLYSWKGATISSLLTDGGLALVSWKAVGMLVAREKRQVQEKTLV